MASPVLLAVPLGALLIVLVIWDGFETIVLPRNVARQLRLTRLFYSLMWSLWSGVVRGMRPGDRRESLLGVFAPLSLLLLFALWANLLIVGFGLVLWGLHAPLAAPEAARGLGTYLYQSGVTFFTLGYGDVTSRSALGRIVDVAEAGVGFGLLAVVISYFPVLYQSFSRREAGIALLDARAGSPPAAGELLRRHAEAETMEALGRLLERFENWSGELLESFISYPILAFYRSQHEQQSWLAALTTILDVSALVRAGFEKDADWARPLRWQARLTFALARHVLVDLAYILQAPPVASGPDRLPPAAWERLCADMDRAGAPLCRDEAAWTELGKLRREYEPFVLGLARHLFLAVPSWIAEADGADNWQTSAWDETHF